jgi:hypothetical protein
MDAIKNVRKNSRNLQRGKCVDNKSILNSKGVGFKMNIELRVAEKNEGKSWDRMVEASTYGTIFHTWKWLKIIEKHTKSKLYPNKK